MKKLAIFVFLVLIALPTFADDAMVLPAGVFRISAAPSYGFVPGSYDTSGTYAKFGPGAGSAWAVNTGFALEYGVTDWISAAVQWAPGWNITSNVDTNWSPLPDTGSKGDINGLYDLFLGAKVQLVGEKAPIKSQTIRFCTALGVKIPVSSVDFADTQWHNYLDGADVTVANLGKDTLGVGGRIYADYIFSDAFYLNLFCELIYYPFTVTFKDKISFADFVTWQLSGGTFNPNVDFGYDFKLELEPHYIYRAGEAVQLEGSLPLTLTYSPDLKYDGTSQANTSETLIAATPTVSVFLTKLFIPLKFKLSYSLPIIGWNANAQNAIIFIVQAYLKFW